MSVIERHTARGNQTEIGTGRKYASEAHAGAQLLAGDVDSRTGNIVWSESEARCRNGTQERRLVAAKLELIPYGGSRSDRRAAAIPERQEMTREAAENLLVSDVQGG